MASARGPRLADLQSGTVPSPGKGFGDAQRRLAMRDSLIASAKEHGVDIPLPGGKKAENEGDAPKEPSDAPLSVSEALGIAKGRLDGLPTMVVSGEVTGFRGPNARSGHCYFQVKDDSSSMDVIVWRGVYAASGIELRDGLQVQLSGKFDVYLGSGRMSFIARKLEVAGEGLLRQQVAELARKLEREGLMAPERKRKIPRFCTRVAVVTSLSGSVIDDVKRTLRRRNPLVELLVVGAQVQGPGAPQSCIAGLMTAALAKPDCILLVRGGGSFEDLMTFNDEVLARAVAGCPVPVVTGIGHEPDTCICDMVADRRTSTPTAAAESVAPAFDEIVSTIDARAERLAKASAQLANACQSEVRALADRLMAALVSRVSRERLALESLASRRCLAEPASLVESRSAQLMQTEQRLHDAIPRNLALGGRCVEDLSARLGARSAVLLTPRRNEADRLEARLSEAKGRLLRPYEQQVARLSGTLDALSPLKVLARGYAIAQDGEGHVVSHVDDVSAGDQINVRVSDGIIQARVL